jgi:hypothetical protein
LVSILNPSLKSSDETLNYSIIDTSLGHGSGRNLKELQWDHQTGNSLASIDDHNTIAIWEMGETMQNWKLVEKLTLRMPFVLFSWFQVRQDVLFSLWEWFKLLFRNILIAEGLLPNCCLQLGLLSSLGLSVLLR